MRKWFTTVALLGVAGAGWFFWHQHPSARGAGATHENATPGSVTATGPPPATPLGIPKVPGQQALDNIVSVETSENRSEIASAMASVAVPLAPGFPHEPEFTNIPPEIVLERVAHAVHDYASMFGGNPVGTNPEITAALAGDNPRHINFLDAAAGLRVNQNGETVDPWGTPFFFHQLSGTEMEIRSAGPDRILWTYDDLVVR